MAKLANIFLAISVCSLSVSAGLISRKSILGTLLARQSDSTIDPSDIPSQCQSACSSIISTSNSCQTSISATCACSLSDLNDFEGCLSCLVALAPSGASSAQESLDQYVEACDAAGVSLPSGTLSGVVVSATAPAASSTRVNTVSSGSVAFTFTSSSDGAFTTDDGSGNAIQTSSSSRASASATQSGSSGSTGPLSGFNSATSTVREGSWAISIAFCFISLVVLA